VVKLPGGATAFVKIAAYDYTADWLRNEHDNYVALQSSLHIPRLLGWDDDDEHPALAIEDLSAAVWPPPWSQAGIDAVFGALDAIHSEEPPYGTTVESLLPDIREAWADVRRDPSGFLRMGFASAEWIGSSVDALEGAARAANIDGSALLHLDVRSDNVCLRDGLAVLVDWNMACSGDPSFDVAAWLPSLADEGGPAPWEVLPGEAGFASLLAGYFCARAGLSPIPQAPHARPMQLTQGRVALEWAARELGLSPPA
jgi:hypothetical protein